MLGPNSGLPSPPIILSADMDLNPLYLVVVLGGSRTKNGKEARLPLGRPTAKLLKEWLEDRAQEAHLWPGNWARNREAGGMLQHDLKAAGIPFPVNGKFADFHALRKTFVTNLARSGAMPKVA